MVIVIVTGNDGTLYYYTAPWNKVEDAKAWAEQNCNGFEWETQKVMLVEQPDMSEE